jgi:hypothetical protein
MHKFVERSTQKTNGKERQEEIREGGEGGRQDRKEGQEERELPTIVSGGLRLRQATLASTPPYISPFILNSTVHCRVA